MRDDDPKLDAALAALSGIQPNGLEDDDRWAKRVASRVSTFAPPSRRELDPFLAAPFPDDHQDLDRQDFDQGLGAADDHGHAAVAADFGDAHGWEGSMTEDDSRPPPNSLAALSGLTRSGPSAAPEPLEGAAKGDDSGLIDLRAMSQPEPEAAPVETPAAAAPVSASEKAPPVSLKSESPASTKAAAVAAVAAPVPPSSTAATATTASAAAAAPRAEEKKKGGAVIWIAFGGLAAAAAAAFFVVGPMAKKDEASTASAPAAAQPEKQADDNKVAAAEKPVASAEATEPTPQATAAPAATEEHPHPAAGTPAKPGGPVATGGSKALVAPEPAAKPTASAAPTVEAPKSAGTGSLDEVLGIGKDQPTKKVEAADNLPDKPDSMDIRSAINAKVGAASACVKGLDGPSNVAVTFGPTGGVSGVAVSSGPAKGTGAESCIKNAFSSAKVPASKKGATGSATLVP